MSIKRFEATAKDKLFFSKYLGIEFEEFREGYTKATLNIKPELLNRLGLVHGGVTYSLMDTCMGGAVFSLLNEHQYCVAMEVKTNYLRSATDGQLVAEARVAHSGRKVAVTTCEVHDGKGNLIAIATGSFYVSRESK